MITFMPRLQWSLRRDTIIWNQFSSHNYAAATFYLPMGLGCILLFIIYLSQLFIVVLHCVPQFKNYFCQKKIKSEIEVKSKNGSV